MEKRPKKVKVYGLDSTKSVRARLIEILIERSMYHKDKFIAPVLWDEMRSMEVKKSGKVEHSDKTHDDNVFSLLMALYVWYDGKNLAENFQIRRSTLYTDDNRELEEVEYEEALEQREKIDFRNAEFEPNQDIADTLEWIEANVAITSDQLRAKEQLDNFNQRNVILSQNQNILDKTEMGVIVTGVGFDNMPGYTNLPNNIYDLDDDFDEYGNQVNNNPVLQGNLSQYYDKL